MKFKDLANFFFDFLDGTSCGPSTRKIWHIGGII
jgi:hypothetical protein